MARKGILLAGGAGTRLYPLTLAISKQLMPVYDKPLIYYPLSVLMLAHIRDVLIISTPKDLPIFERLLGDGTALGMNFQYATQLSPDGIAQSFCRAETFLSGSPAALVLGDNIFYGQGLSARLQTANANEVGATIFAYAVNDAKRYGVVEINELGRATSIEEKPIEPKSNMAVTGLYFCDNEAVDIASTLRPSARGELEITDLLNEYMARDVLNVELLGRGFAWLDTGTHDSLLDASTYVAAIERRQDQKISCLEEIAWRNKWIGDEELLALAQPLSKCAYGIYLKSLIQRG